MFHIYIKQHAITGMKYLGYTIRNDPFTYKGSGKYWTKHIHKHGIEHVVTTELYSFHMKQEAWELARELSELHDVVTSREWANLKPEGIDGGRLGVYDKTRTDKIWETRRKGHGSNGCAGRVIPDEVRAKIGETRRQRIQEGKIVPKATTLGRKATNEERAKMSQARRGRPSGAKGKTWTRDEEANKKLSASVKGRKRMYLPDGSWTWSYPKNEDQAPSQL